MADFSFFLLRVKFIFKNIIIKALYKRKIFCVIKLTNFLIIILKELLKNGFHSFITKGTFDTSSDRWYLYNSQFGYHHKIRHYSYRICHFAISRWKKIKKRCSFTRAGRKLKASIHPKTTTTCAICNGVCRGSTDES